MPVLSSRRISTKWRGVSSYDEMKSPENARREAWRIGKCKPGARSYERGGDVMKW